jgi:hypothetical protein
VIAVKFVARDRVGRGVAIRAGSVPLDETSAQNARDRFAIERGIIDARISAENII